MPESVTSAGRRLLDNMAAVRDQVCRVRANDPLWDKAQALKNAIDDMAGELTGDREYFFAKHHSLCQGPPADRRG